MKISRSIYINSLSIIILLGQIIVLPLLSQIYCTLTDNISSIGYEHEFLLQEQLQELGIPFMGEWLQHGMQCESGSQSLPSMLAHTFSRTFAMEIVIFQPPLRDLAILLPYKPHPPNCACTRTIAFS